MPRLVEGVFWLLTTVFGYPIGKERSGGRVEQKLSDDALKNLFDALSTANLTVLAVSLGLLSIVWIALNDVPNQARKELHQILQIQAQVGEYSPRRLIREAIQNSGTRLDFEFVLPLRIDPKKERFTESFTLPFRIQSFLHPFWDFPDESNKDTEYRFSDDVPIGQLGSVGQFRFVWDSLAKNPYLFHVQSDPNRLSLFLARPSGKGRLDFVRFEGSKQSGNLDIQSPNEGPTLVAQTKSGVRSADFGFRGFLLFLPEDSSTRLKQPFTPPLLDNDLTLVIESPLETTNVNPFSYFFTKLGSILPDLRSGASFDETFPNLTQLGLNYRSLKLSDLDPILEEQSKRSKGQLEVFGAKIPSELVPFVGLPLLLAMLLQFTSICHYIRENVTRISADTASKWSILLRGFGFLLFGIVTTFGLPVLVTVLSWLFATPRSLIHPIGWGWVGSIGWGLVGLMIALAGVSAAWNLLVLRKMVTPKDVGGVAAKTDGSTDPNETEWDGLAD